MSEYWPFVIIGVSTGAIYGLAAVGLMLTYKTSGIFNFAHGAIATVGALLMFLMYAAHDWPWWLALLDAVFIAGPVMGLLMEQIARALTGGNASYKVVATLGLVLTINFVAPTAIQADNDLLDLPAGSGAGRTAAWLPSGVWQIGGVAVGHDRVIITAVGLASVVLLTLLLRRTLIGIQMRAVVDDANLLGLTGTSPLVVRRSAWILGSTFAAMSGALLAPQIGQNFGAIGGLVVKSAGAAAFGAFTNLPLAFAGGIVVGVAEALLVKEFSAQQNWLSGLPAAIPFILLFVALLVVPKRWLSERFHPLPHRDRVPRQVPVALKAGPVLVLLAALVIVPHLVGFVTGYTRFLTYVVLFLSMGLLVKTSGQMSLGHFGFAAVGAAVFHHLAASAGLPWLLALVLAGIAVVPVGVLVALPAIRLSGVFLALATYAFAIGLESLFYRTSGMFSTTSAGVLLPRPGIGNLDTDVGYYYVVLAIVIVCVIAIVAIVRSRLGRLLAALGESPTALETQGTTVNVVRTAVFCISAFFAGIAGALFGAANFYVTGSEYASEQSLVLLVLVMLAPGGHPWFAFSAAVGLAVLRGDWDFGSISFVDINLSFQLVFGLLATRLAMNAYKRRHNVGLRKLWRDLADRFAPPISVATEARVSTAAPRAELARTVGDTIGIRGSGLEAHGLTVQYGALRAVDGVDLAAPTGRITGLVGPNGAGKSTTFDACSGLVRPSGGRILLHGRDVTDSGPAARARLGLGRTFQRVELWNSMTVEQNVTLGREGSMAGSNPLRQLAATRAERARIAAATDAALELCGLTDLRHAYVGGLTTGQRRLVELARCLAGPYDVLLLDEPSSGLDTAETRRFGEVLRLVVAERGCGILLVEHDMSLVMDVCSHIYVLDLGHIIFAGSPDEVRMSEMVRAAYLGSTATPTPTPTVVEGATAS